MLNVPALIEKKLFCFNSYIAILNYYTPYLNNKRFLLYSVLLSTYMRLTYRNVQNKKEKKRNNMNKKKTITQNY